MEICPLNPTKWRWFFSLLCDCVSLLQPKRIGYSKMAEGGARPSWADLPTELITLVADRLGIIDLLRFLSVCKSWNYAASRCSAQIESTHNYEPWFLLYGEDSHCILLSGLENKESQKKYNINIPELNGATCIASRDGWLLLRQETTIFFFCPFSRSRIDLPQFPDSEHRDYIGAFSSPPTSKDCIVCVVAKNDKSQVELRLLHRGANEWTTHIYTYYRDHFEKIKAVAYENDEKNFHIFDDTCGLIVFSPEDGSWKIYRIIDEPIDQSSNAEKIPFHLSRGSFKMKRMKKKLGLGEDVSVDTCGTVVSYHADDMHDMVFFNENISQHSETQGRRLKGAWIEPRFHKISQEVSWHL
ncbi:F-box protein At4g00893-like [Mangifera indica]|uniref:F-box protein At4g00893-like n=1 Tax=Mangifera indica TaxID=29780 RepID=UPI001CFA30D5|nr:F-box protein At4g00893-like [Mangifera indica]